MENGEFLTRDYEGGGVKKPKHLRHFYECPLSKYPSTKFYF